MIIVRQQPPEVVIIMTGAKQELEFRSWMIVFFCLERKISKNIEFLEILSLFHLLR